MTRVHGLDTWDALRRSAVALASKGSAVMLWSPRAGIQAGLKVCSCFMLGPR